MDWPAVTRPEWISLVALLVAVASATFTWRNFRISARKERREVEASRPLVEHYIDHFDDLRGDYLSVRIVIRNRAGHGLIFDGARPIDRTEFGIYDWRLLPADERHSSEPASDAAMDAAIRDEIRFDQHIDPQQALHPTLLLALRRPIPEIRLQLSLSERLPDIRRSTITVKIRVPEATVMAVRERSRARPSDV